MYYANKDAALGPEERAAKLTSELIRRRGG